MRSLWVNGKRYDGIAMFLRAIGVNPNGAAKGIIQRALHDSNIAEIGGVAYLVLDTPPRGIPQPERHVVSAAPIVPAKRLLARDHACVGLHQDRGEHYRG